jgi:hypothetical protein
MKRASSLALIKAVHSEGIPRTKGDVRVHIDFRLSGA